MIAPTTQVPASAMPVYQTLVDGITNSFICHLTTLAQTCYSSKTDKHTNTHTDTHIAAALFVLTRPLFRILLQVRFVIFYKTNVCMSTISVKALNGEHSTTVGILHE